MFPWTEQQVTLLLQLETERLPRADIAARLGTTAVSVKRKLARMRAAKRDRNGHLSRRRTKIDFGSPSVPRERTKARPDPVEPLGPALSLHELPFGKCKFPTGDGPFVFACGRDQALGSSYCAGHHRFVYQPPTYRQAA